MLDKIMMWIGYSVPLLTLIFVFVTVRRKRKQHKAYQKQIIEDTVKQVVKSLGLIK